MAGAARYPHLMSPTVLRIHGFRFYFFCREEPRPHVHVRHGAGRVKIWLAPAIEVASHSRMDAPSLARALRLVRQNEDLLRAAWEAHRRSDDR